MTAPTKAPSLRACRKKARPISKGFARQWYRCAECGTFQHLDYVRYSLSNPILIPICGHGFKELEPVGRVQRG